MDSIQEQLLEAFEPNDDLKSDEAVVAYYLFDLPKCDSLNKLDLMCLTMLYSDKLSSEIARGSKKF